MAQQMRQPHSIMDRHLIQKDLKTTKFIASNPTIKFDGEPPF